LRAITNRGRHRAVASDLALRANVDEHDAPRHLLVRLRRLEPVDALASARQQIVDRAHSPRARSKAA
jgi:hypothetical protein